MSPRPLPETDDLAVGDIVDCKGARWDVVAVDAVIDVMGEPEQWVRLERISRGYDKRGGATKKTLKYRAARTACRLVGRQVGMFQET